MCLKLRAPIYFWRSKWKTAYIFTNFSFCYGNAPKRWFQPANGVWSTCLLVKIHNNAVLKANNKVLFDWMTQQYLKVYSLITSALRIIASIWANNDTIFFYSLKFTSFLQKKYISNTSLYDHSYRTKLLKLLKKEKKHLCELARSSTQLGAYV